MGSSLAWRETLLACSPHRTSRQWPVALLKAAYSGCLYVCKYCSSSAALPPRLTFLGHPPISSQPLAQRRSLALCTLKLFSYLRGSVVLYPKPPTDPPGCLYFFNNHAFRFSCSTTLASPLSFNLVHRIYSPLRHNAYVTCWANGFAHSLGHVFLPFCTAATRIPLHRASRRFYRPWDRFGRLLLNTGTDRVC